MPDSGNIAAPCPATGRRDAQTVDARGRRAVSLRIAGVEIVELGNVLTRSGTLLELFRKDWAPIRIDVQQVNYVQLNAGGVTDWHRHELQTDHLVGVGGNIKLALFDGRAQSPTGGQSDIVRLGALRPVMVIVPPGVWHALRNESGEPAGYLNVIDRTYDHADPDNWRLDSRTTDIPDIL